MADAPKNPQQSPSPAKGPQRGGPQRGGPQRGPQRGAPRGGQKGDGPESAFEDNVVKIYRCATVVKGGQRFSFAALVVVGDRRGRVGIGYGKANQVPSAVEKAIKNAHKNIVSIKLEGATLPHKVKGRYGASLVVMVPASEGTGVIAGASVRAVLELAGVHNVLTKSYGSNSPKNLVRATFEGLRGMINKQDVEKLRGVKLAS